MQTLLLTGVNPTNNVSVIPRHVLEDATTGSSIMFPTALYPEQSARLYGHAQYMYSYRGVELIEHGGASIIYKLSKGCSLLMPKAMSLDSAPFTPVCRHWDSECLSPQIWNFLVTA
mgnify:FL=1